MYYVSINVSTKHNNDGMHHSPHTAMMMIVYLITHAYLAKKRFTEMKMISIKSVQSLIVSSIQKGLVITFWIFKGELKEKSVHVPPFNRSIPT